MTTAQIAKYQAVFREIRASNLSIRELREILNREFPCPADRKGWRDWMDGQIISPYRKSTLTPATFIETIDHIQFLDKFSRTTLVHEMQANNKPWIPLGRIDTVLYRLAPTTSVLCPNPAKAPSTHRELLPECFLAANTTVQPREPAGPANRRALNLSEESTISAESDDVDLPEFVFFQLGCMQHIIAESASDLPRSYAQAEKFEDEEDSWHDSGFAVVARLDAVGRLDSIYVIFNMFPIDDITYKREAYSGLYWGTPETSVSTGEQFSCARIGRRLADFGWDFQLRWEDKIEHPIELVRVVMASNATLLPITVDKR